MAGIQPFDSSGSPFGATASGEGKVKYKLSRLWVLDATKVLADGVTE